LAAKFETVTGFAQKLFLVIYMTTCRHAITYLCYVSAISN